MKIMRPWGAARWVCGALAVLLVGAPGLFLPAVSCAADDGKVTIKSLASDSPRAKGEVGTVHLLGQDAVLAAVRDANGLTVDLPAPKPEGANAPFVLKIALGR
jgi:hypothetical protein